MEFHFIPNDLYEIIERSSEVKLDKILAEVDAKTQNIIIEYIEFLISNDLAVLLDFDELSQYPPVSLNWDYPSVITNAIIDHGSWCDSNLNSFISQLDQLGCFNLQVRCYSPQTLEYWINFIEMFQNYRITTIEFILKYDDTFQNMEAFSKFFTNPRVRNIQVHSTPLEKINELKNKVSKVYYWEYELSDEANCGEICPQYFSVNFSNFTESLKFNTCLNRKISVDKNGTIKNCPSMRYGFGQVNTTTILEVLHTPRFQALWNIKKDEIEVCKDCEFRYMCTDCRAYVTEPDNLFSKPAKCGYNPYEAKWQTPQNKGFAFTEF